MLVGLSDGARFCQSTTRHEAGTFTISILESRAGTKLTDAVSQRSRLRLRLRGQTSRQRMKALARASAEAQRRAGSFSRQEAISSLKAAGTDGLACEGGNGVDDRIFAQSPATIGIEGSMAGHHFIHDSKLKNIGARVLRLQRSVPGICAKILSSTPLPPSHATVRACRF